MTYASNTNCNGNASRIIAGSIMGAPWEDISIPIERRVLALISNMTTEEKISQLNSNSPAIDHLGVSAFNWWTGQDHLFHLLPQCL